MVLSTIPDPFHASLVFWKRTEVLVLIDCYGYIRFVRPFHDVLIATLVESFSAAISKGAINTSVPFEPSNSLRGSYTALNQTVLRLSTHSLGG